MKEKQEKNKNKMISYIVLISFIVIMIGIIIKEIRDINIRKEEISNLQYKAETTNAYKNNEEENNGNTYNGNNSITEKESNSLDKQNIIEEEKIEENNDKILDEYKGYRVSAKLEIPKINLETYILKQYSTQALKISVTKFWGAEPNTVGNFCIAGHNFQNNNMFHNLRKLTKGDKLTISDNTVGKVDYEVYDTYQVKPEEVSCLSQKTHSKREVTLITCTIDSQKRIIVKAREV